eukprot:3675936-Heterocapsa_arctica.AAC.1
MPAHLGVGQVLHLVLVGRLGNTTMAITLPKQTRYPVFNIYAPLVNSNTHTRTSQCNAVVTYGLSCA